MAGSPLLVTCNLAKSLACLKKFLRMPSVERSALKLMVGAMRRRALELEFGREQSGLKRHPGPNGWLLGSLAKAYGDAVQPACLMNRDFNLTPESAKCSVELLEPSCMVQAKEPLIDSRGPRTIGRPAGLCESAA